MTGVVNPYMHRGGREGRDRLSVLARIVAPTTYKFLDRLDDMSGWYVIDAGCGGGDVSFELSRRVGEYGRVTGLDADEAQLSIVRAEATERGIHNLSVQHADLLSTWPVRSADMVYMRFVLTHLADSHAALTHAFGALSPGGILVVEDVDMAGHFCFPPSTAFDNYYKAYLRAAELRGADPFIGLKLDVLLAQAGFTQINTHLVQPFGRSEDLKALPELTMASMGDGLIAAGSANQGEVDQIVAELKRIRERPEFTVFMPRIFQVTGLHP